jgi:hypothetical protein
MILLRGCCLPMKLGVVEKLRCGQFLSAAEVGLGQPRFEVEVIEVLPVLFYF